MWTFLLGFITYKSIPNFFDVSSNGSLFFSTGCKGRPTLQQLQLQIGFKNLRRGTQHSFPFYNYIINLKSKLECKIYIFLWYCFVNQNITVTKVIIFNAVFLQDSGASAGLRNRRRYWRSPNRLSFEGG